MSGQSHVKQKGSMQQEQQPKTQAISSNPKRNMGQQSGDHKQAPRPSKSDNEVEDDK